MGIPFDFQAMSQGLGQGANLIQQYLWQKYMQGQEMKQFKEQQGYLDEIARGREERQFGRQKEFAQYSQDIQDKAQRDYFDYVQEMNVDFLGSPEYRDIHTRATSPEGTYEDKMTLVNIDQLLAKQSQLKPLEQGDYDILQTLPTGVRLKLYEREGNIQQFLKGHELQMENLRTQQEYMRDFRIPSTQALIDTRRSGLEDQERKREKETEEDIDSLQNNLRQAEKDLHNFMSDEMNTIFRRKVESSRDKEGNIQTDKIEPWVLNEYQIYQQGLKELQKNVDYYKSRIEKLKKKEGGETKAEIRTPEGTEHPTEGDTGKEKITPEFTGVAQISPEELAQAKQLRPDLTEEEIIALWKEWKASQKKDELKHPGSWAGR